MKKILLLAVVTAFVTTLNLYAQDIDIKSIPAEWGEISSVREIIVPIETEGPVPFITEFLIVETPKGIGFLEKEGNKKYFYPSSEEVKIGRFNAAFITADGRFVPSILFDKGGYNFVWTNPEQGEALYLNLKRMPQPLWEMCRPYPGSPQWRPGKMVLIRR